MILSENQLCRLKRITKSVSEAANQNFFKEEHVFVWKCITYLNFVINHITFNVSNPF